MYTLKEIYDKMGDDYRTEHWNGRLACVLGNAQRTLRTNELDEAVACYSFTLVLRGTLLLDVAGQSLTFGPNDMYVYMPGFPLHIVSVSDDYESIALLVDEQATYEAPAFRNLIRTSFYPLTHYGEPKLTLDAPDAQRLHDVMLLIRNHIQRPPILCDETLEMLYSVFLLDLTDLRSHSIDHTRTSNRTEDIFIAFYTLLRQHYCAHHDIGFYAERLHITTTYLSRIVRQKTGRTVVECINRMLVTEARWLLTSTTLTVSQIAERLHFATTASFDKFFFRLCGRTPKSFRRKG